MQGARRLTRACAVALSVVTLGVLAACGDSDDAKQDQAYIEQVNAAMQRFAQAAERLPTGFEAETLHTYSAALDRAASSLRRIEPPASVARLHERLASDVAGYADEIDKAAEAPLSSDPDRVLAAQQRLMKAAKTANADVNETLAAIGRTLDDQS